MVPKWTQKLGRSVRREGPVRSPDRGERGAALLEAAIALALVAGAAAAALSAYAAAARGSAEAAERLAALSLAQTVLEEAAAPEALAIAAEEMGAERAGREDGFVWRVVLAPHEGAPEDGPPVIALTASVGAPGAPPLVTLRTARALR